MLEFLGQDKLMIVPFDKLHCNVIFLTFRCVSKDIFHTMQRRLLISLSDKRVFLRRRSIKGDLFHYEFCDKPSEYILRKTTKIVNNVTKDELIRRILKGRFGFLLHRPKRKMRQNEFKYKLLNVINENKIK